ncbi:TauD/TfdA family dioxygenase [Streptomyces sp. TLI_146]|uniref:TauD/TfdA family dioxygenase n=1 Tax=Streptomyces sp. TLI_146 TaxID=1938858 RepID=UPI000C714300|nr:TauD/TfdA family dioxygenase [Streptomyces sp. TLI_146]PKV84227.1 TfdA family taurine catabolism dioxygenase TauD [Streptomyces sp. TLI_146]
MSHAHALRAPAPPFQPATTLSVNDLAERLRETGLVSVDRLVLRSSVTAFADRIMRVTAHRDSDARDGLTTIYDTRRDTQQAGYGGFTSSELAPHTERSGIPRPPRLMLLVCAYPAATGGECLLTDGRAVHADLAAHHPDALDLLSTRHTAFFGGGDGHASQVFTPRAEGRVSLRLRLDALARWSPLVEPHLPALRAAIQRHQLTLPLQAGQGYLLDNSRWLHARTSYTGDRLMWRALGEPLPQLTPLPTGFRPAPRTPDRAPEETAS